LYNDISIFHTETTASQGGKADCNQINHCQSLPIIPNHCQSTANQSNLDNQKFSFFPLG
jgi:hypothetical protein